MNQVNKSLIMTKETWTDIYQEIYGKSEGSQETCEVGELLVNLL